MHASKGPLARLLSAGIAAGFLGCLLIGQPSSALALSAEELAKAQANFKAANPNGDTLNPAQFKAFIDLNAAAGIGRAGRIKSNNAYDRAFGILDTDKSGTVTWEEYLKAQ